MHAPLTLIDGTDVTRRGAEDRMIAEALNLLDRRYFSRGECLFSPTAVADYLKLQLAGHHQEVFAMVCLDARHRTLSFEKLFFGSIDSASVYPREIVIRALACNAAAVIFAHNHPSGCAEPSQADRNLTAQLKNALALVEVRVLDHFVVGEGKPVSLAEMGWL